MCFEADKAERLNVGRDNGNEVYISTCGRVIHRDRCLYYVWHAWAYCLHAASFTHAAASSTTYLLLALPTGPPPPSPDQPAQP